MEARDGRGIAAVLTAERKRIREQREADAVGRAARGPQMTGSQDTDAPDPLDVLKALGFEECSTGGGCTALEYTRPDGQQCLVTNDALAPEGGESWDVGFYNEHGEQRSSFWYGQNTLLAALANIAEWRVG